MTSHSNIFEYNACIVRPVSSALVKALRMEEPENPINVEKAHEQHKGYTDTLKQLIQHVFEVIYHRRWNLFILKLCGLWKFNNDINFEIQNILKYNQALNKIFSFLKSQISQTAIL